MFFQNKKIIPESPAEGCKISFSTVIKPYLSNQNFPRELSTSATYINTLSRIILLMREYIPEEINTSLLTALIKAYKNLEKDATFFIDKTFSDYDITYTDFPEKYARTKSIECCRFYLKTDNEILYYAFRQPGGGIIRGSFSEKDFDDVHTFQYFQSIIEKQHNDKHELQKADIRYKDIFIATLVKSNVNNRNPKTFLISYLKKVVMCLQVVFEWINSQSAIYIQNHKEVIIEYIKKIEELGGNTSDTPLQTIADYFKEAAGSTNDIILKTYYEKEADYYQNQVTANTCKEVVIQDTVGNIQEPASYFRYQRSVGHEKEEENIAATPTSQKFTESSEKTALSLQETEPSMSWLANAISKLSIFTTSQPTEKQPPKKLSLEDETLYNKKTN